MTTDVSNYKLVKSQSVSIVDLIKYYDTSGRLVFVRFLKEFEDAKKPFRN